MNMGQALAKRELADGLRLYRERKREAAIRKWRRALHRTTDRKRRFVALGYLATAHAESGRYRDALACAVMQIEIADEETDGATMRAEAYLSLARSSERLGEYHRAVAYARRCLQTRPADARAYGRVYLTQGDAYVGFSDFGRALEMLEYAVRIAKRCADPELEIQIYATLGHVFLQLKDYDKGLKFQLKAIESAKSLGETDPTSKYRRLTLLNLGIAYQKLGRYAQALECCEAALKLALDERDRPVQARCLCCLANIYRLKSNFRRATQNYEAAVSILVDVGDKIGQVEVLVGMAKNMESQKESDEICECKALEYNKKALNIASSIGNKLHMLKCHRRMEKLYRCLGDTEMEEEQIRRCEQLEKELELQCAVCGHDIGDVPDTLELFSCFHMAHARCTVHIPKQGGENSSHLGSCPKCSAQQRRLPETQTDHQVAPTSEPGEGGAPEREVEGNPFHVAGVDPDQIRLEYCHGNALELDSFRSAHAPSESEQLPPPPEHMLRDTSSSDDDVTKTAITT